MSSVQGGINLTSFPGKPEFHVKTTGTAGGDGSNGSPWDLTTAIGVSPPAAIVPGSTVYIHGGSYTLDAGADVSVVGPTVGVGVTPVNGTIDKPIVFRRFPGESRPAIRLKKPWRPGINGGGNDLWWVDIEFFYNDWNGGSAASRTSAQSGSFPTDVPGAQDAVFSPYGLRSKFLHCIFHDLSGGIGPQRVAPGAEVYGCISYNNGWQGSDRGHGQGTYTQNDRNSPLLSVLESIAFNNFDNNFQNSGGPNNNILHQGDVAFNPGVLSLAGSAYNFVGGARDNTYDFCYGHSLIRTGITQFHGSDGASFDLGFKYGPFWITNCYIVGGINLGLIYDGVRFAGNTVVFGSAATGVPVQAWRNPGEGIENWDFGDNKYYNLSSNTSPFKFGTIGGVNTSYNFADWQNIALLGSMYALHDTGSTYATAKTGVDVFVRPTKKYKDFVGNRGHVIIYNWDAVSTKAVDISPIVDRGQTYNVYNVQSDPLLTMPVATGTYNGGTVTFPTTAVVGPNPFGTCPVSPPPTSSNQFNCYVVTGS